MQQLHGNHDEDHVGRALINWKSRVKSDPPAIFDNLSVDLKKAFGLKVMILREEEGFEKAEK